MLENDTRGNTTNTALVVAGVGALALVGYYFYTKSQEAPPEQPAIEPVMAPMVEVPADVDVVQPAVTTASTTTTVGRRKTRKSVRGRLTRGQRTSTSTSTGSSSGQSGPAIWGTDVMKVTDDLTSVGTAVQIEMANSIAVGGSNKDFMLNFVRNRDASILNEAKLYCASQGLPLPDEFKKLEATTYQVTVLEARVPKFDLKLYEAGGVGNAPITSRVLTAEKGKDIIAEVEIRMALPGGVERKATDWVLMKANRSAYRLGDSRDDVYSPSANAITNTSPLVVPLFAGGAAVVVGFVMLPTFVVEPWIVKQFKPEWSYGKRVAASMAFNVVTGFTLSLAARASSR